MTGFEPYPINVLISISYIFKKQTVDRFVDGVLNELKVN
ncbi:hypothetical protein MARI151_10150 [Maribacter litoralis]|uniref:Uncharacterized protein n=1 Tax=Maribacter litoralis TaxID=2059726 RepID=A0A653LW65_9FLAO|nr:hypothetical protein MARI151_10150 [Maribacter litoralis]